MKKSNKGFTLVELIVVIAIIGILAAILVPAMIGYISDSKLSSANSSAKTVYTAAMAGCQKLVNAGKSLDAAGSKGATADTAIKLDLTNAGKDSAPTTSDYAPASDTAKKAAAAAFLSKAVCSSLNVDASGSVGYVRIGSKGFPIEVCWAKGASDKYVGAYPIPKEESTDSGCAKYVWSVDETASTTASSSSAP